MQYDKYIMIINDIIVSLTVILQIFKYFINNFIFNFIINHGKSKDIYSSIIY